MSERDAILGQIRQALRTAYLPDTRDEIRDTSEDRPSELVTRHSSLVTRFTEALAAVGGEVWPAAGANAARELISGLLRETNTREVLAWPDEALPLPLAATLAAAGIRVTSLPLSAEPAARRAGLAAMDGATVGLTGALGGLADTGSLALLSGPARPMTASLLPLVHVALLRESDILPDMAAFLARHSAAELTAGRTLVFITGPSRTADIEMIITRGVHGPKRLIVILLGEGEHSDHVARDDYPRLG